MLSRAQEDFNNSGAVSERPGATSQVNQKFAGMQLNNPPPGARQGPPPQHAPPQHQPLMKQLSSAMPDITSPNVVNFFAAAQQPNGVPSVPADVQILQSQNKQFIRNLSIPPVQTVDEIEKQHRVSTSPPVAPIGE